MQKTMPTITTKTKRVQLHFDGGIDCTSAEGCRKANSAKLAVNCKAINGGLREGVGLRYYETEGTPVDAYGPVLKYWQLKHRKTSHFMLCDYYGDNIMFIRNDRDIIKVNDIHFVEPVSAVIYNYMSNITLFLSDKNGLYYSYGDYIYNIPFRGLTDLTVHYERLFGLSPDYDRVWFCSCFEPKKWDESEGGGYIELHDDEGGKMVALKSFADNLYIFRDRSIVKLTAKGNQQTFKAKKVATSVRNIIPNTVCVCGDRIIFLTQDGLHSFDGNRVVKILPNLDNLLLYDTSKCCSVFDGRRYLLAFRSDWQFDADDGGNNALLLLDVITGQYELMGGVDIKHLSVTPDNVVTMSIGNHGGVQVYRLIDDNVFDSSPLTKLWRSQTMDCDMQPVRLQYMTLITQYPLTVIVTADNVEHRFQLTGSDQVQRVPLNIRATQWDIAFQSTNRYMRVSNVHLVYKQLDNTNTTRR